MMFDVLNELCYASLAVKTKKYPDLYRQVFMKVRRLRYVLADMKRDDARASSLAVGALLVVTLLYVSTMV